MRIFLGTFLEPEYINNIPFSELEALFNGNLKSMNKTNTHITWLFIGEVNDTFVPNIINHLDGAMHVFKDIVFNSHKIQLWPPKKTPRLIVIDGKLNKNISLEKLCLEIKDYCVPDLKKDFIPHITIARFKKDVSVSRKISLPAIKGFSWNIKEIKLIKSTLQSSGPVYESIKTWHV